MWCVRVCHGWDDMMCGGCYRYLYMTCIGRVVVARVFVWRDRVAGGQVEVRAADNTTTLAIYDFVVSSLNAVQRTVTL